MRALVTGVAGFIGSHLAKKLLDEGYEVIGVDSFTDYYDPSLKVLNVAHLIDRENFKLVRGDLLTLAIEAHLDGVDHIFHLAGQPGVRGSWGEGFEPYVAANILVTQRLLEAAKSAASIKKFVYASSSSVYGDAHAFPTAETDRPQPVSPYGVTKLAGEHLCYLYAVEAGVPTTSLRYFTVYGPRQRPDMAFTRFLTAAIRKEKITVYGDGTQIRDFTYVDDVVRANILAARGDTASGAVFNVSGGSDVSVNEVLETIRIITGNTLNVVRTERASGDVFRTGGSANLIRDALGWEPRVMLSAGLQRQYEWLKSVHAGG